jgi:hypothetical protein
MAQNTSTSASQSGAQAALPSHDMLCNMSNKNANNMVNNMNMGLTGKSNC